MWYKYHVFVVSIIYTMFSLYVNHFFVVILSKYTMFSLLVLYVSLSLLFETRFKLARGRGAGAGVPLAGWIVPGLLFLAADPGQAPGGKEGAAAAPGDGS